MSRVLVIGCGGVASVAIQKLSLIHIYNRENTQKVIDAILREKAPEGFHGFLILDMDHFRCV